VISGANLDKISTLSFIFSWKILFSYFYPPIPGLFIQRFWKRKRK